MGEETKRRTTVFPEPKILLFFASLYNIQGINQKWEDPSAWPQEFENTPLQKK